MIVKDSLPVRDPSAVSVSEVAGQRQDLWGRGELVVFLQEKLVLDNVDTVF